MSADVVAAIVLAGGAATRFGGDKLAADLDGSPVLHHALRAVATVADDVVLVLAPEAPVPALPPELDGRITVARDRDAFVGPLAGVAAGLDQLLARDHPPRIALVVGGDMPGLVPAVLRAMAERLRRDWHLVAITLEATDPAPLPMALRPADTRDALAACLAAGRRSLRSLLGSVPAGTVPAAEWHALDADGLTLRDVDTRGDLAGG